MNFKYGPKRLHRAIPNSSSPPTVLLAVIVQAVVQVGYGLDCYVNQLQVGGQSVCQALVWGTAAPQASQRLANQLLADAGYDGVRAGGVGGGWSDHTHQTWGRVGEELGCVHPRPHQSSFL